MSLKFACLTLITCEERVSKKFKLFLGIFSVIETPSDELFRHANTSMEDESTPKFMIFNGITELKWFTAKHIFCKTHCLK